MKTAIDLWRYVSQKGLKPLPKTSVSEWADDYRVLSSGISSEPGRWRTSRAPYQREIMNSFTQPGINRVVVKSASQIGKALDVATPIPTPCGWANMEDIAVGDKVFDENGRQCNVIWQSGVMTNRPCYEVCFSDGATIVADAQHKWYVQSNTSLVSGYRGKYDGILTTEEIANTFQQGENKNRYAVPVAKKLVLKDAELALNPYLLGVWLGDGNSYSAQITTHRNDLEIFDHIKQAGYNVVIRTAKQNIMNIQIDPYINSNLCKRGHDKNIVGRLKTGFCAECHRQISLRNKWKGKRNISVDPVVNNQKTMRSVLAALDLIGNKHIPKKYLRASAQQRLLLLQGLMDTDGTVSKKGRCEITMASKILIDDISELLHSLGIKHTVKNKLARCTNSPNKVVTMVWRISFMVYNDTPVFKLKRKLARLKGRKDGRSSETERRRIVDVRKVESRPVKCIEVDSPNHLYLAGTEMIPTHNSDIMNNVIGRYSHLDPATIMMIQPTIDMAQDYSKSRIAPMLRDTKALNNLFYDVKAAGDTGTAKSRDGNNTILSKIFPGGRLIMCGANSPAGLASRPVRVLLADEVDRFPDSAGTEGDPVDLAAKRMTTFWNRVMGLFSTPTNEGASRIDTEYAAGTQEEWQHKCPGCGEYHLLRYQDMQTDYTEHKDKTGKITVIVNGVKWRCPDCGFSFTERQMKDSPQKYVPQNKVALKNGIRSFFLNAFTSPWITWDEVMKEWFEAKGDPKREQVIMNTRFGESYRQVGAFDDEQVFLRRREEYKAMLPKGILMLTAAVDTQDNRLEYEVCGWGTEEEAWGILKGIILGAPDQKRTWQELDTVLDRLYSFESGKTLRILRTFIDSGGHYTSQVYDYCQKNKHKQRFAIKGQGGPGIPLNYKIGRAKNTGIALVMLGVDDGKQQIMNRLSIEQPGPQYFHYPKDEDVPGLRDRGYDELYFKGIISEHKKNIKKYGQVHQIWVPVKEGIRNEPLDLRVYNLACMRSCKPNWGRLQELVEGKPTEPKPQLEETVKKTTRKRASKKASSRSNLY